MTGIKMKKINTSELGSASEHLKAGERVELYGYVYTARDAAHIKIHSLLDGKKELPFEIRDAVIYYAGPTPVSPLNKNFSVMPIGSCGPTTSGRMDRFTPVLLELGLAGMIGKGERSEEVKASIIKNKAVYFSAIGGAGALAAKCVKSCETVAFEELGCESVKRILFSGFPLIVALDSFGGDIYSEGRKKYKKMC